MNVSLINPNLALIETRREWEVLPGEGVLLVALEGWDLGEVIKLVFSDRVITSVRELIVSGRALWLG